MSKELGVAQNRAKGYRTLWKLECVKNMVAGC